VFWCPFKVKDLFLLQSRNQNLKNWEFPMLPKRLYVRRGFSFLSTSSLFLLYQQSNSFTYFLITKFRNSQNAIAKYPFIVLFYAGEYGKIIEWQHQTKKVFREWWIMDWSMASECNYGWMQKWCEQNYEWETQFKSHLFDGGLFDSSNMMVNILNIKLLSV